MPKKIPYTHHSIADLVKWSFERADELALYKKKIKLGKFSWKFIAYWAENAAQAEYTIQLYAKALEFKLTQGAKILEKRGVLE